MKILKGIIVGLVALVLGLAVIGFFLPRDYSVERTIVVQAPAEHIFPYLHELPNWKLWMAWYEKDPDMKITYSGPSAGVGAISAWESKTEGSGEMEVKRVIADQLIEYELRFPSFEPSTGQLELTPMDGGTQVRWSDQGRLGINPFFRYFGLMLDGMIGKDFETGLAKLKNVAESNLEKASNVGNPDPDGGGEDQ